MIEAQLTTLFNSVSHANLIKTNRKPHQTIPIPSFSMSITSKEKAVPELVLQYPCDVSKTVFVLEENKDVVHRNSYFLAFFKNSISSTCMMGRKKPGFSACKGSGEITTWAGYQRTSYQLSKLRALVIYIP